MSYKPGSRIRKTLAAGFIASALVTLSACGGSSGDGDEGVITIGYSGPLSGGAAVYGQNVNDGIKLAVDKLNELGVTVDGKKHKVEFKALDDMYAPNTAATNAQRLADQEGAAVVFIPHSGGIQAAQEINAGRSEFIIFAHSSDPEILAKGNPNTVAHPPMFTSFGPPFSAKAFEQGKRLGLLGTASEYGQGWTKMITEEWKKLGGEVLTNNSVDYGSVQDFASPVSQTLAEKPDVIFVGGPSQPTALIVEEARKQGYEGGFVMMDQAKLEEMELFTDPKNLRNTIGLKPVYLYDEAGTKDLLATYEEEISGDVPVTAETTLNYQGVAVMVKAMEVAGSIDDVKAIREAIPEALEQVDDAFRVSGFPDRITDEGHLMASDFEAAIMTESGEYEFFPIPQ